MCDHAFELIDDENICIHCLDSYKNKKDIPPCCDFPDLEIDEFLLICKNCACGVDSMNWVCTYETEKRYEHRKRSFCYKRLKYFRQKLHLINTTILFESNEINMATSNEDIRSCSSIQEIVEILSKLKMRKFIKNAYEIYYTIHKKKLIKFSPSDLYNLEKLFIEFERTVKQNRIKYLNNYNEIIYHLMNKLGIAGSEHILKPRTFKKNENLYKNILGSL